MHNLILIKKIFVCICGCLVTFFSYKFKVLNTVSVLFYLFIYIFIVFHMKTLYTLNKVKLKL